MHSPALPQEEQLCQDEGGGVGASPDGLPAKPLLIGHVRDSEQVQGKALSYLFAAPTSLFGFVLLCQLAPFDMHINTCFINGFLQKNQSRSPCGYRHKKCLPQGWVCHFKANFETPPFPHSTQRNEWFMWLSLWGCRTTETVYPTPFF